jgi:hypothetical protein
MIIRVSVFIIITMIFLLLLLGFIKDLGENRKKIEKKAKEVKEAKEDAIKNSNQNLWKQGPKRKR